MLHVSAVGYKGEGGGCNKGCHSCCLTNWCIKLCDKIYHIQYNPILEQIFYRSRDNIPRDKYGRLEGNFWQIKFGRLDHVWRVFYKR